MEMAFTFVANSEYRGVNNNAYISKPAGTADGDIMIIMLLHMTGFVSSAPSGWTNLGQVSKTFGGEIEIFYKIANGEGTNYQFFYDSSSATLATMCTYRGGFNILDPIDVVSNTEYAGDNTSLLAASMNVSAVNSPLIFLGLAYSSSAISFTKPTAPTNSRTERYDNGDTTVDVWGTVADMVRTSSGASGDISATISTSIYGTWKHAFAIALNPPSTGNPGAFFQMF